MAQSACTLLQRLNAAQEYTVTGQPHINRVKEFVNVIYAVNGFQVDDAGVISRRQVLYIECFRG